MSGTAADLAVRLPWLAPGADALVALAGDREPLDSAAIHADPAALAWLLRFDDSPATPPDRRAALLRSTLSRLKRKPIGVVPTDNPAVNRILRQAAAEAELASEFAPPGQAGRAYAAALLRSLGRLAIASVDPGLLYFDSAVGDPADTERRLWGASASEITRRLARRWRLPDWCQQALAAVDHEPGSAAKLGGDEALASAVRRARAAQPAPAESAAYRNPYDVPLLARLLHASVRNFGRKKSDVLARMEAEADRLHAVFAEQVKSEEARLRDRKLTSLAELAAGAGHEINTPLAIISGQAQYLFAGEDDPARRKSLATIVQQAHRVHEILTDLMQFARPAKPEPQVVDLAMLVREVDASLADAASLKGVRIETDLSDGLIVAADPRQARTALHNLVRNAIEATPEGGSIRLSSDATSTAEIRVVVEDTGPGVPSEHVAHLFDPFFCGRQAGRGRGLGLSTAWRLAKASGGDVRFISGSPTTFVLALPRADAAGIPDRLSA